MFITKRGNKMKSNLLDISNVLLNDSKKYIISKEYIDYLIKLETLNYLKNNYLIDINLYDKAKVYLKKSHIGK